jgi:hypothetical protein
VIADLTEWALIRLGAGHFDEVRSMFAAFFVVGATILAGRWLLGWQMRRIERILGRKLEPSDVPGSGSSDGDTGEPRG